LRAIEKKKYKAAQIQIRTTAHEDTKKTPDSRAHPEKTPAQDEKEGRQNHTEEQNRNARGRAVRKPPANVRQTEAYVHGQRLERREARREGNGNETSEESLKSRQKRELERQAARDTAADLSLPCCDSV